MVEKLKIICRNCGEEIVPHEYNTASGELWILNGCLYGEMLYQCSRGHRNYVNIKINEAQVLEVCNNA